MIMRAPALLLTFGAALAVSACQGEAEEIPAEQIETVASPVVDMTVEELLAAQAGGTIRLIDVRTDEEVAEGVIPGAEHIVLDDLEPGALASDDGREVVFYCRSGNRSTSAAEQLSALTGKPVRHLEGGIMAWQEAGQTVSTPTIPE